MPMAARTFPRLPLYLAWTMALVSVLAAGAGRLMGPAATDPGGAVLAARDLLFEDRADGGIAIRDAADQRTVDVVQPGDGHFMRATLRGLATRRKRIDVGAAMPFRLTAWDDGRLTLQDPATGRVVELEAFGPTNSGSFARLLPHVSWPS